MDMARVKAHSGCGGKRTAKKEAATYNIRRAR